ncbi:hypothetical protein ACR79M_13010 [Sphingobacterium spiritivorum]|uniref:hypothetical protein n=1 Tax=Sphingobacterium spiritivorum TaxID=258 RepID=UPI003DA31911
MEKHMVGGFLTIRLEFSRGISSPQVVLVPHIDSDGIGIRDESIVRHHLTWTYKVIITNNSEHASYFPRLHYKNDLFPEIEIGKIEELESIGSKNL